jgi:hypothetical protein
MPDLSAPVIAGLSPGAVSIGVLLLIIVVLLWLRYGKSEGLMPGDTHRFQRVALSGSEALDNTRTGSYFAAAQQGAPVQWAAGVVPGQPMSNAEILASPDFNCAKVQLNEDGTGAWDWQNKVMQENMMARPRTESDMSLAMAGL